MHNDWLTVPRPTVDETLAAMPRSQRRWIEKRFYRIGELWYRKPVSANYWPLAICLALVLLAIWAIV